MWPMPLTRQIAAAAQPAEAEGDEYGLLDVRFPCGAVLTSV